MAANRKAKPAIRERVVGLRVVLMDGWRARVGDGGMKSEEKRRMGSKGRS